MHFSSKILTLGVKNASQETIAEIAFILAKVMDEKLAKTKASYLTLSQDIW